MREIQTERRYNTLEQVLGVGRDTETRGLANADMRRGTLGERYTVQRCPTVYFGKK